MQYLKFDLMKKNFGLHSYFTFQNPEIRCEGVSNTNYFAS